MQGNMLYRARLSANRLSFFAGLLVCSLLLGKQAACQQIAFTWDDLPAHSSLPQGQTRLQIATDILSAMKEHHLPPAYGFVNGIRLEQEPDSATVLAAWRAAGNPLANHAWSHMNLNENTVTAFMTDVRKNESLLGKYMPAPGVRWLRYPYLAEGETFAKRAAVRAELAKANYKVAAVTMSFGDYAWNEPYARCLAKGDDAAIHQLEASYLQAAEDALTRDRAMSHALAGRDIPYVLLMHVGAFDARMLPRLLTAYEKHGVSFIMLEQAQADPFYREDMDPSLPSAEATTLEGALTERHVAVPATSAMPDMNKLCR